MYDNGVWLAQAEYLRQLYDFPNRANQIASLASENPFDNGLAFKFGRRINESIFPYAKLQTTFTDETGYQAGGGVRYRVAQDLFAYVEEMWGNIGDSTLFGLEKYHDQRSRSYANIRLRDQTTGTKTMSTTVGSSYALTENSRVFSEREHSTYDSLNGYADILGYEGDMNDHWDYELRYERRHLDNAQSRALDPLAVSNIIRANDFNTVSGALAYADGDKLRARTHLEVRKDSDAPKLWQWLSRNSLEYKINQDLGYLGRLEFGKTRFTDPGDNVADFLEFNTGFSYRPIDHDRFNMLSRYTYLRNSGSDAQYMSAIFQGVEVDETSHIIALDFAYDMHRYLSVVEKVAYKNAMINSSVIRDELMLHNFLWAHRFNFHVTRKWDVAAEYRFLWQSDLVKTLKHGTLLEVDREIYEYVRFGVGYNFTDFDDDLRKNNNYDSHGPFVRFTGKF